MEKTGKYKRILVTSALTYANGDTHLGHIAGSILPADMFVRYSRLAGYDVIYVCGSDEYGTAIEMSAIKEGISPQEIVDKYHFANKKAYEQLGMSFDIYSRTSTETHKKTAQDFFTNLYNKDLLYQKTEKQLYSEKEQRFLADRFVIGTCPVCGFEEARGDECENCGSALSPLELKSPRSTITGDTPVVKESTHFYFPLSKFQPKLEEWINSKTDWKPNVVNYCKGWFKTGLQDRAITRDLAWGVPLPMEGFDGKVIYVWFEAPMGYISITKELFASQGNEGKYLEYWGSEDTKLVHFLGKDNIIFHAIFFPAMLMAHGDLVLAENVPANEFMNLEGSKQSKSKGHAIYVKDVIEKYNPDSIRYAIASNMPENKDTDFYWSDLQAKNNNELGSILGNFVNRTFVFAEKYFDAAVPEAGEYKEIDINIINSIKSYTSSIASYYENYKFKDAVSETMNLVRDANKYFNDTEPWKVIKEDKARCGTIINTCLQLCRTFAVLFNPVLPFTSEKLYRMLNIPAEGNTWDNASELKLSGGHKLNKPEILFARIEDTEIEH
ncbi:MAG TPA: methionine--tRNA ligase [Ignavibacteria bacterium]|nr:methionine--tRNA ligase [Ignavibacteria bacterium]HRF66685.1 methionine--tRNA ligase [Ignavibacteria bacterium]HRJ05499.1 methionine--tRNA ligase [Ignavibacteria bacterium]